MGANQRLVAQSISHNVGLQRVTASTVRELIKLLRASEEDILAQIQERLRVIEAKGFDNSPATMRRLDGMLIENRRLMKGAYGRLGFFLRKEMRDLGDYEMDLQGKMLAESIGVRKYAQRKNARIRLVDGKLDLALVRPPASQLIASIERSPFQGAIMSRWIERLSEDDAQRIQSAINNGLAQRENVGQIMRRLRGTKAAAFTDGVLETSRRHAETWARTAMAHVANEAQDAFYGANAGLLEGVIWNCVLEPGICEQCLPRHGKLYGADDHKPIGHALPWLSGPGRLHPRDKCSSFPQWRKSRALASEVGLATEEARKLFGEPGHVRITGDDWLRSNPSAAKSLYGEKRAKLYLDGGVSADDLIRKDGKLWTLAELKGREAEAYKVLAREGESG